MKQIIDFEKKGNTVRFYLGKNGKQYGDDWNDRPYEHNAGKVYDEFIKEFKDITFPFESFVLEPSDGIDNSIWSKEDMIKRKVPCIIVLHEEFQDELSDNFNEVIGNKNAIKFYFGDEI